MYDARRRERFRGLLSVLTGVVTVASATAAGAVTGLVAREAQAGSPNTGTAGAPAGQATAPTETRTVVTWKQRPRKTIVRTRVVYRQTTPSSAGLGGGSVTSVSSGGDSGSPSGTGPAGGSSSGATRTCSRA